MPTIHTLATAGAVQRVDMELRRNEFPDRHLYLSARAAEWIRDTLPTLNSSSPDADMSPYEQVFFRLKAFIIGKPVRHWLALHVMNPQRDGVWELKTIDIRMFGWFPAKDHFVIARVDTMERCKTHDLYRGYLGETVRFRSELNLDEPTFIAGGDLDDVISNAD